MKKNIKVLFVAAEAAPIAKVGGLGDVVGALPKALAGLGVDARIIIPFYGSNDQKKYKIIKLTGNLWQTFLPQSQVPVYLIKHKLFQDRHIYHNALASSATDIEKFFYFSQAILPAIKKISWQPDIIHLNDWHVAAVASQTKIKTVLTVHNLANQGKTPASNLLAQGIENADAITTVSPTYAKEILTKDYGCGLEKVLAKRKKDLYGILNGIDTDFFNPATDKFIKSNFTANSLSKKSVNKTISQKQLGLSANKNTALVGLVTRFVWQKGVDLITESFSELNCQFVFLGLGEKKYEQSLLALAKKYPKKFKVMFKFDEALAHQIYAASDIFLVPSRFEPCGLTQLIAMRYASVPVVRQTGGLKDTVNSKVGFSFKNIDSGEFFKTLKQALDIFYRQPNRWRQLQLNGMIEDFSWEKSAEKYLGIYKKLAG